MPTANNWAIAFLRVDLSRAFRVVDLSRTFRSMLSPMSAQRTKNHSMEIWNPRLKKSARLSRPWVHFIFFSESRTSEEWLHCSRCGMDCISTSVSVQPKIGEKRLDESFRSHHCSCRALSAEAKKTQSQQLARPIHGFSHVDLSSARVRREVAGRAIELLYAHGVCYLVQFPSWAFSLMWDK